MKMTRINSRQKGARGERELAALLREYGLPARRGQQFAGGPDSPDVKCDLLNWLHIEVKRTERLNLRDACAQASGDSHGKRWVLAHKWNFGPLLAICPFELLLDAILGRLPTVEAEAFAREVRAGLAKAESNEANERLRPEAGGGETLTLALSHRERVAEGGSHQSNNFGEALERSPMTEKQQQETAEQKGS